MVPGGSVLEWRFAVPCRESVSPIEIEMRLGQHDRALSCRRPGDQIQCEFPARTASKARTESIDDLLRE